MIEGGKFHLDLYYPLTWSSCKQSRISHSSFGAEIIAAADNDNIGY